MTTGETHADSSQESDEYGWDYLVDAGKAIEGLLARVRPGALRRVSLARVNEEEVLEVEFSLDSHPGVEFSFRRGIRSMNAQPDLAVKSAVGVLIGSLIERIDHVGRVTDARVDLTRRKRMT